MNTEWYADVKKACTWWQQEISIRNFTFLMSHIYLFDVGCSFTHRQNAFWLAVKQPFFILENLFGSKCCIGWCQWTCTNHVLPHWLQSQALLQPKPRFQLWFNSLLKIQLQLSPGFRTSSGPKLHSWSTFYCPSSTSSSPRFCFDPSPICWSTSGLHYYY